MDNALIFNVRLSTLIAWVAFTGTLASFCIAANFESGRGKLIDYFVLDPSILTQPVIVSPQINTSPQTGPSTAYVGRVLATLKRFDVEYNPNCDDATAEAEYRQICEQFKTNFSNLSGEIVGKADGNSLSEGLYSTWQTLTTVFSLSVLFFTIGLAAFVFYLWKVNWTLLWVSANWAGGLAASALVAYFVVLHTFRKSASKMPSHE